MLYNFHFSSIFRIIAIETVYYTDIFFNCVFLKYEKRSDTCLNHKNVDLGLMIFEIKWNIL